MDFKTAAITAATANAVAIAAPVAPAIIAIVTKLINGARGADEANFIVENFAGINTVEAAEAESKAIVIDRVINMLFFRAIDAVPVNDKTGMVAKLEEAAEYMRDSVDEAKIAIAAIQNGKTVREAVTEARNRV